MEHSGIGKLLKQSVQQRLSKSGLAVFNIAENYFQDGLFTVHNDHFRREPSFRAAYERGVKASNGVDPKFGWRVHTALWAASTCLQTAGDFVECGVNAGFISSAVMQYLDWDRTGRDFHLIDTFAGPVMSQYSPAEIALGRVDLATATLAKGAYVTDLERVRTNFADWSRTTVVHGAVPDVLETIRFEDVAFVHLDMNCSWPEAQALKFFFGRMSNGGMILFDDYAYVDYEAQRTAIEEIALELNIKVLSLPTGQGLVIK